MNIRGFASVVAAAAAGVALAACSSASSSTAGPPQAGSAAGASRMGLEGPRAVGAGTAGSSSKGVTTSFTVGVPPSADIERSVTAAYTVAPGSFLASFESVIARAVSLGGYVASSHTEPDHTGRIVSGAVTVRLPAARIADLLDGMPPAFFTSSINFATVDHTAEFVDLNARLASAHAHLAALNALLAKASSITDITNLEQQVEAVQAEANADQGELNVLAAAVEMATATVRMSERGAVVLASLPANAVTTGIGSGWENAVRVTGLALEGFVSAVPILVLLAAGLVAWRRLSRAPTTRGRSRVAE